MMRDEFGENRALEQRASCKAWLTFTGGWVPRTAQERGRGMTIKSADYGF